MTFSVSEVINSLPIKQDSKVIVVGDGLRRYLNDVSDKIGSTNLTLLNIDPNKKSFNIENKFKEVFYSFDNGKKLPFRNKICDVLILAHSLRFIMYRESFLKDCVRIIKNGGLIVVIESAPNAWGVDSHPDTKIIFDDMLEYLDRAGFLLGENFDTNLHEYGIIGVCPLHNVD